VAGRSCDGDRGDRNHSRLGPIFTALTDQGVVVEPVLFSDGGAGELVAHLSGFDALLVWVDPISGEDDRTVLDGMLRAVASRGVWVSAHPDTIVKMGTKKVLYRTRASVGAQTLACIRRWRNSTWLFRGC
jgi:hypothetical protein